MPSRRLLPDIAGLGDAPGRDEPAQAHGHADVQVVFLGSASAPRCLDLQVEATRERRSGSRWTAPTTTATS
jgi:hypothetical protein